MYVSSTRKDDQVDSIIALSMAINGNSDSTITEFESEQNIANNLVDVCNIAKLHTRSPLKYDGSEGTGLMITTNGFILTAYHNIEQMIPEWERINREDPCPENTDAKAWLDRMMDKFCIRDTSGNRYPIDLSQFSYNTEQDIALIKAYKDVRAEPINFRIKGYPLKKGEGVRVLGRRNGREYNQHGKVMIETTDAYLRDGNVIRDTFQTDAYSVPGFSGGVITSLQGELAGLTLYADFGTSDSKNGLGMGGGAKAYNLVNIVRATVYAMSRYELSRE